MSSTTSTSEQELRASVAETVKELLNLESSHRQVEVSSVEFNDKGKSANSFRAQRKAKDGGGDYSANVMVQASLKTKDGKVISKGKVSIGRLPLLTKRLTYILGGREYQVSNQFRRMPGVYTRISDRGEVQGVIVGKTGERSQQMKMYLDPLTYQIIIRPVKGSTSKISLYNVLRAAGKTNEEISKSWGKEMVRANSMHKGSSDTNIKKSVINIAQKMLANPHDKSVPPIPITNERDAAIYIFKQLSLWTMDPRVTSDTIGKAHTSLTSDALMDTGKQMLNVSRGISEPSTYNNIGHKKLNGVGDLVKDYLLRNKYEIQQAVKNRMGSKSSDIKSVLTGCLNKKFTSFFRQGGETQLVSEADMTNPLATIVGDRMTTVTGMGGISVGPGMQLGKAQQAHSSHIGFLDPVDTGEKSTTGLQLYMTLGSEKVGDRLHTKMYSLKEKKVVFVDPITANDSVVAFPDDVKFNKGIPVASKKLVRASTEGGKTKKVPFSSCDYVMLGPQSNFALNASLIPFLNNNNGNRVMIGAKMANQAVSLINREEPLVQVQSDTENTTMEKKVGSQSALVSPVDGTIQKIGEDFIKIKSLEGKHIELDMYNEFPTNDPKSMLNHEPLVRVGQFVKKGEILADSNYTRNGTLALGSNLRLGYLPMRGYNYEDGVVISRSASEKLSSEHLYTFRRDCAVRLGTKINAKVADAQEDSAIIINKDFFRVMAPRSAALYKNFNDLDEDGVIKEGSEVHKNYILIAACRRTDHDPNRALLMKSTKIRSSWTAAEESWTKDSVAKVTRVVKLGKDVKVYIRSVEPMKIGDKLVGRYGNKGIVTKVLENHEMPFSGINEDGERQHIEVAMHPAGVPGRINIGQLMEMGASKIAEKTGKIYKVKNFDSESKDRMRELIKEMKSHGLSDQEQLFDPKTEKSIGSVIVGKQYIQKLTHQVDKKMAYRSGGTLPGMADYNYDINNQPKSGAPAGGQAMGALGIYALLGHNARAFIRDLQTYHSTYEQPERTGDLDSDEYWNSIMTGRTIPSAKPTFAATKFFGHLKAMGVDPVKNGDTLQLVPMTDKDVLKNCPYEVKNPNLMLIGKNAKVEKGGLFDFPNGQVGSSTWGHIKLQKRIINPVFEKPVAILLGIQVSKAESTFRSMGMANVCKALKSIDVNAELASAKKRLKDGARKSDRNTLYKKIKVLNALKELNLSAFDAYTMKNLPVLPPKMRPISLSAEVGAQGDLNSADINQLYKNVGMTNLLMKMQPKESTEEDTRSLHMSIYSKVKEAYIEGALDNKGAPINSLLQLSVQPREASGKHKQAKEGFFQKRLIKRRSELSGRSVITPEPDLKLDQVGIPRKMALGIYRPFVVRQLRFAGYSTVRAAKLLREEPSSPQVREALEKAIADRPLLMKRDPSLHKHNVLAFYPKITESKSIQIHPLVCGGFNADFDGDTMGVWVPSSDDAREEAKNMIPSKNLFGAKGFQLMNVPEWGAAYGIWQLTEWGKRSKAVLSSHAEAYALHKKGALDISDIIKLNGKDSTVGRIMLFEKLPQKYKDSDMGRDVLYGPELNKSKLTTLLGRIAKESPDVYPRVVDDWKDLGNKYAHEKAWSFGLKDFVAHSEIRDRHLAEADEKVSKLKDPTDSDKVRIYGKAANKIRKEVEEKLSKDPTNRAYRMTRKSGAMDSKYNQVEQIVISPLQVTTSDGKVVPDPVRMSYSEGLGVSDYWDSIPGVRTGTLSRVKGTEDPGAKAKDLVNLNISSVISMEDCGTTSGVQISTRDRDLESRYLSKPVKAGSVTLKQGTLITPKLVTQLRKHNDSVEVRSPLKCKALKGVCSKCSGFNERGKDYTVGENVGVISAQSLSEPLTQMAMNAFHTGGSASGKGASVGDHFQHLARLMSLPEVVRGEAKISEYNSKVVKIEKNTILGGHHIFLEDEYAPIHVAQGVELLVKVGDTVTKGQPLCEGPVNPHKLLEVVGMPSVREHLINEMQNIYGEYGVRRRHVEMLIKNLTNTVEVVDDPLADYAPKDRLTEKQVKAINISRKSNNKEPIKYKAVLLGISQAVRVSTEGDWLAQLNYQRVRESLMEGMAYGGKSSMHGLNPIPGMAIGATLGKTGKSGEY